MPQPADVATPPAPPQPPGSPAPVARGIDVGQQTIELPRTTQDLQGLRERREILRDQLERANNRRDGLLQQLRDGENGQQLAADARTGVQQRLAQSDARILQIEQDIAATEQSLSNANPALLARAAQEERRQDNRNRVDEDEAVGAAFGAFGAGVVLTLVISRIRRRFARRRAAKLGIAMPGTGVVVAAAEDPRIDRLAQAVDAIAEEVERIGEGQRFVTQLLGRQQAATQAIPLERER